MKCTNCGCENKEASKFCKQCGAPIVAVPKEVTRNVPQNVSSNVPNKSTKNKTGIILIILLSVILVVGITLLILILTQNKKVDEKKVTEIVATTEISTQATTEEVTTEETTTELVTEAPVTEAPAVENAEFIFADSDVRYLTEEDIQTLSKDELAIARNEIYARHGYIFTMEEFDTYFRGLSWYHPEITMDEWNEDMLNDCEKANRSLILDYEKEQGYVK